MNPVHRAAGELPGGLAVAHVWRPAAISPPDGALVLFHGRGADEHDLAPLFDLVDPGQRLAAATPRAPLSLPPGGAHWYVVRQVGFPDTPTFAEGLAAAAGFVDALVESLGTTHDHVLVGGFSQGAVMASAVALGSGRPRVGGLAVVSGFIPEVEGWTLDPANAADLPVLVSHGTYDPVIAVDFGRSTAERLDAAGADVAWLERPVDHSISPTIIPELQALAQRAVPVRA